MKSIILLFVINIFVASIVRAADSSFIITGKLDEIKSGTIFLNIHNNPDQKISTKVVNGQFKLKGFIKEPSVAILALRNSEEDYLIFFVEPGEIHISGKGLPMKDLTISNSPLNEDDKLMQQQMEPVNKWEGINAKLYEEAAGKKNVIVLDSLDKIDFEVLKEKRKIISAFVKEHPHSLRSAIAITENYAYYAEADEVQPLYDLLDDEIKNSYYGKDIHKLISGYKAVAIGMTAPDITQPTPEGSLLSLSSLRGKYVLIDFWASWCGPCRRENPNIVTAYNEYYTRGFDIFGVSYDTKKVKWEKAIKDDQLKWHHVSDLQGWKNKTSDLYRIKAIPSNLLLNTEGKIVAKNVFGKKLTDLLATLIK